jgi:membrane-bound serine protease (ClpP class)
MMRWLSRLLIVVGLGGAMISQAAVALAQPQSPHAALIEIDGSIHAVAARYVERALATADEEGARVAIVTLDTPGGLLSSTRDIVGAIQESPVPVVVYVSPSGARAASAGTFIAASAHVAAMAPVTNIGAASPVSGAGGDLPEEVKQKATQDAAAFMREIAATRGRNADALTDTIIRAKAYSATEAVENNVVDLIAGGLEDLLSQIDGRTVQIRGRDVVLDTAGLEIRSIDRTQVEQFLGFIANPNIAFLLFVIGSIGLVVEIFSPGLIGPGVIGVLCLALAFLSFGYLPVNWVGVALMVFAVVLFFLELQAPGVGIFGIAGVVSFLIGAFFLFGGFDPPPIPTQSFRVSLWLVGGAGAVLAGLLVVSIRFLAADRRTVYVSPSANLVGQSATVMTALAPKGSVQVIGETWTAVTQSGRHVEEGEEVVVEEVDGLTLRVSEADGPTG